MTWWFESAPWEPSPIRTSESAGRGYGVSGPVHYGLWGALMILFIYPFGRRFRELAPTGGEDIV
ncbi:MAG: hypothetical protein GEV10_28415 [Streptosporangiales bacterium]|nr:hypothetical protein [Streptosporangiales bacterium]